MNLAERIERTGRENPGVRVDCYVLFASHTDAMQLYGAAREAGISARVSATPRLARSSCGVALLVSCGEAPDLEALARAGAMPFEDIVALPNQIDPHRDVYC